MTRGVWILASLVILSGVVLEEKSRAQFPGPGDVGPGAGGAKLRIPGLDPDPAPAKNTPVTPMPAPSNAKGASQPLPEYLQRLNPNWSMAPGFNPSKGNVVALPPSNRTDLNRDIEIKSDVGPWVIFVMSYPGEKAPEMAREFVIELRNKYKLKAYIYNYGAKEKQEEYERVQKLKEKQKEALLKAGLDVNVPIRVPTVKIEEYVGVLVGGYKDRDAAFAALQQIRKLTPPDPKKFAFDIKFMATVEQDKSGKGPAKVTDGEAVYVNPFHRAFPARNPTAQENSADVAAEELKTLRKINQGEEFSLFNCKGKLTLVVSRFNIAARMVDDRAQSRDFFGFMKPRGEDGAAHNAHNLAEAFRKNGLPDTYVLHTKFCSFVTVGGYDSETDPRLLSMQKLLAERFRNDAYRDSRLGIYPTPQPMLVPR